MEIIFLIISIFIPTLLVYSIGRTMHSHSEGLKNYKEEPTMFIVHLLLALIVGIAIFTFLCAVNNTVWELPYLIH